MVEAYRARVQDVDLASIEARERVTRHDVKARIEEFSALAGHEHIHKGMTSRDLTENVEQMQIRVGARAGTRSGSRRARRACPPARSSIAELVIAGRTHNVPAQATTVGKRIANSGEELLQAYYRLEICSQRYPLRGIKGPVGTPARHARSLRRRYRETGAPRGAGSQAPRLSQVLDNVGQVYPRSLDLDVVSALVQLAAGPSSFATTLAFDGGRTSWGPKAFSRGRSARAPCRTR